MFIRTLLHKDSVDSHSPAFLSYNFNLVGAVLFRLQFEAILRKMKCNVYVCTLEVIHIVTRPPLAFMNMERKTRMSAMQVRVHASDWVNVCSMIRRVWPWIFGPAGTCYEQK